MWNRKSHFVALVLIVVTPLLWIARATSRYEAGDTPGEHPGVVPCAAKRAYEAAATAATAAEERYKKLAEPDWSRLSYGSNPNAAWWKSDEGKLAKFLHDLKQELEQSRKVAAYAGNPNPDEAEKNYRSAKARHDDLQKKHREFRPQITALENEIKVLLSEIQTLDAKLAKIKPPSKSDQDRKAALQKYEGIIASTQRKIQSLTGTDDMKEARRRVDDKGFVNFSNEEIKHLQVLYDQTPPATPEFEALDGRLTRAIEEARQAARTALAEYAVASRALSRLQAEAPNDAGGAGAEDANAGDALRRQRAAKHALLQSKSARKAELGLQVPSPEELGNAQKRLNAAAANRELAVRPRALAADVKAVEPWIEARMARNAAQSRLKKARAEYDSGIQLKDARLGEVRRKFNALQTWIATQRKSLQGRDQDAEYWKIVAGLKSRALAEYSGMEADLSGMDCFADVGSMLSDIRARRSNVQAIRIGQAVEKKSPVAKTPTAGKAKDIAGWWVWVRGRNDRVPLFLNPKDAKGVFNGVYFPGINTRQLVTGQGPTVRIAFKAASGNSFRYRYKYPNPGKQGGIGGGTMTLAGTRMAGPWADDTGGAKGNWTLERPTAAELARLRQHFGRG